MGRPLESGYEDPMDNSTENRPPNNLTEESQDLSEWVKKAKAGNTVAFGRLTDLFHDKIFRMVYYRTRSRMDAEDLTQDIFIKAFNGLSGLRENSRFKGWLFSIAANRVRDFHRRSKFQWLFSRLSDHDNETPDDPEMKQEPDALENLMKQDFWNQVDLLLNKLSKMEKEVFVLRFMDNLNINEIAQMMKKSESTIKTFLYRSLKKFRNEPSLIKNLKEAR